MPRLRRASTFKARALRRSMTAAEAARWALLRDRRQGYKFRRQHPVGPFVVDFYCHEAALVVEVDGSSHDLRAAHDRARDQRLAALGLSVLHRSNREVLAAPQRALQRIRQALEPCRYPRTVETRAPLPGERGRGGRGNLWGEGKTPCRGTERQAVAAGAEGTNGR